MARRGDTAELSEHLEAEIRGLRLPGRARRTWERTKTPAGALVVGLLLLLVGGLVANTAQTGGGNIRVESVRFPTAAGQTMAGLLYVPDTATAAHPACAVDAIHGYINSHDTMDGFAIEMARRGCVVLAPDQTGHGTSDGPAFAGGYGGPGSLAYLNSLPMVKAGDVGLIGHSMGGWASVVAAATTPTAYRSVVLVSSSVSSPPYEPVPGTPAFPRNVAVVEAKYSEFSQLMWGVPKGAQLPDSTRMQKFFGTTGPIVPGHVYGSVAQGTGRVLYLNNDSHPGLTMDPAAITQSVQWMQATLTGARSTPATNQIWYWDEIGTFVGLIGALMLLFGAGGLLLRTPYFRSVARSMPANRSLHGMPWWIGAALLSATGILTFFWFQTWGENQFPAGGIFPENITTGMAAWAVGDALIGGLLFLAWHWTTRASRAEALSAYGVAEPSGRIDLGNIGRSALLALGSVGALYLGVYLFGWAFSSDVRLWVFNIKSIDFTHLKVLLSYLGPFLVYFGVLSVILFGQLRPRFATLGKFMASYVGLLTTGFVALLGVEYGVLFATGELATSSQPLLAIVAYQFVPMFVIVGAVTSYFFWKTGRIFTGMFATAMLVTGIIVAGTALQALPW